MLDTVRLERSGVPTVLVAVGKLARTTGRGMARVQGVPDLAMATIEHESGFMTTGGEGLATVVAAVGVQAEAVLLTGRTAGD